jgi:hypothetical protein
VDANGNVLKRMYAAHLGNIVNLAQKVLGGLSPFEVSRASPPTGGAAGCPCLLRRVDAAGLERLGWSELPRAKR